MSTEINVAALLTGVWFVLVSGVHLFMGGPAMLKHRPTETPLHALWLIKLGAFHLVSVDLLVLGGGLIYLGLVHPVAPLVYQAIGVLCLLYALVWLLQIALWKQTQRDFLLLGQWMLFLVAGIGAFVAA